MQIGFGFAHQVDAVDFTRGRILVALHFQLRLATRFAQ